MNFNHEIFNFSVPKFNVIYLPTFLMVSVSLKLQKFVLEKIEPYFGGFYVGNGL